MDFKALAVFAALLSTAVTLIAVLGIGWYRASRRIRELERQLTGRPPDEALDRLENEISTLSAQFEQLSSGQDFLSRLVADRLQAPRSREPQAKAITPR